MKVNKRVRARLVRRLIWVEELLCSNHNDPIYIHIIFSNDVDDMDSIILLYKLLIYIILSIQRSFY